MANRGSGLRWDNEAPLYSATQVESVIQSCGVEIQSETNKDFLCFCPYHGNKYTPSFSVSKTSGVFLCFNHSCGVTGKLTDLVKDTLKKNEFEALRFIAKMKSEHPESFADRRKKLEEPSAPMPEFPQEALDRLYDSFWSEQTPEGKEYMLGRGFEESALEEYKIGYSVKQNMVTTPMHDLVGKPIGLIGRSVGDQDKSFKNSPGLPTSKTLWNIHRAKRYGETAIICEANFDAIKIAQAGYPNVVACLGGNFSQHHIAQLDRHFSSIVIMTDFDDKEKHKYANCRKCGGVCVGHNPGRALGETISTMMSGKNILWASYEDGMVYPPGVKDAGQMINEQIKQCIQNAVSNFKYHTWHIKA